MRVVHRFWYDVHCASTKTSHILMLAGFFIHRSLNTPFTIRHLFYQLTLDAVALGEYLCIYEHVNERE